MKEKLCYFIITMLLYNHYYLNAILYIGIYKLYDYIYFVVVWLQIKLENVK